MAKSEDVGRACQARPCHDATATPEHLDGREKSPIRLRIPNGASSVPETRQSEDLVMIGTPMSGMPVDGMIKAWKRAGQHAGGSAQAQLVRRPARLLQMS